MKKARRALSLLFIAALVIAFSLTAAASADNEGKNEWNGITWERDPILGALFIEGNGKMPVDIPMPWEDEAFSNSALCFDSGVTEIPAGFTVGCVNMKTIMIPKSLLIIGQGVLAVSGGLSDVYYEGTLQELLSIQMFPEDREAMNGARFHGAKIIYDGKGGFEYVPLSDDSITIQTLDSRQTTVTYDDGTVIETVYDREGNIISQTFRFEDGSVYVINEDNKALPTTYKKGAMHSIAMKELVSSVLTIVYKEDGTILPNTVKSTFADGTFCLETNDEHGMKGRHFSKDGKLLAYWEYSNVDLYDSLLSGIVKSQATGKYYSIDNGKYNPDEPARTFTENLTKIIDVDAMVQDLEEKCTEYCKNNFGTIVRKAMDRAGTNDIESPAFRAAYDAIIDEYVNDRVTQYLKSGEAMDFVSNTDYEMDIVNQDGTTEKHFYDNDHIEINNPGSPVVQ